MDRAQLRATSRSSSAYAKLPLVPLVVADDGRSWQDSTPIIEHFESLHPEPSIHPADAALAFVSALIEEYGDEWGNKPMFHYRWYYEADQRSAAERLARSMMPDLDDAGVAGAMEMVRSRMVPRLRLVGSSPETKEQIEDSFRRQVDLLEQHLRDASLPVRRAPRVRRLRAVRAALRVPRPTRHRARCCASAHPPCWRGSSACSIRWRRGRSRPGRRCRRPCAAAARRGRSGLLARGASPTRRRSPPATRRSRCELGGKPFRQEPQKYHAKSLAALRARYAAVARPRGASTRFSMRPVAARSSPPV